MVEANWTSWEESRAYHEESQGSLREFRGDIVNIRARCGVEPAVEGLGRRSPVPDETETWVTEPEFRIGDALEGDALFSWIPYLRATEDGRIFVLEPNISALSVWDREGEPVLSIGRPGQGPGDFVFPHRVHVGSDGFFVHEESRFTFYADDGTLLRTAPGIPTSASFQGWPIRTLGSLGDGGLFGFPIVRRRRRTRLVGRRAHRRTTTVESGQCGRALGHGHRVRRGPKERNAGDSRPRGRIPIRWALHCAILR